MRKFLNRLLGLPLEKQVRLHALALGPARACFACPHCLLKPCLLTQASATMAAFIRPSQPSCLLLPPPPFDFMQTILFAYFSATLTAEIEAAKKEGRYSGEGRIPSTLPHPNP